MCLPYLQSLQSNPKSSRWRSDFSALHSKVLATRCVLPLSPASWLPQYSEHPAAGSAPPLVPWRLHHHPSLFSHTVLVWECLSIVANTLVLQNSAQATLVGICRILTCTQFIILIASSFSLSPSSPPLIWKPQICFVSSAYHISSH